MLLFGREYRKWLLCIKVFTLWFAKAIMEEWEIFPSQIWYTASDFNTVLKYNSHMLGVVNEIRIINNARIRKDCESEELCIEQQKEDEKFLSEKVAAGLYQLLQMQVYDWTWTHQGNCSHWLAVAFDSMLNMFLCRR